MAKAGAGVAALRRCTNRGIQLRNGCGQSGQGGGEGPGLQALMVCLTMIVGMLPCYLGRFSLGSSMATYRC